MSAGKKNLLLLMTILSQTLLAFVSSNLVSFTFFTARHNLLLLFILYLLYRVV